MTPAKSVDDDDDEMPEITDGQWKHAKRGARDGRLYRVPLSLIRSSRTKTQVDVSKAMDATQGEVSRLEAREELDEVRVATLRRYVEALGGELGGELQLVAAFPDGRRYGISGGPRRE